MEELENQAVEDLGLEDGGQVEVVDTAVPEDAGGAGEGAREDNAGDAAPGRQRPQQTHEDNAAARAARIRAEQETSERLQREYDRQVAGMGIPNPYTGKPFKSFKEFQEYGDRFHQEKLEETAQKQGKSVEELQEEEENRSFLARKRDEEKQQKEAMEALDRQKKFLRADLTAFLGKYPGVDPAKLEQNPKFRKFAGKRLYSEPLAELYGDFVELVGDAERAAVEKAVGKASRGTGGAQGGGMEMLTPGQRDELSEWNRDNPSMKMTAKEFLGR